MRHLRVTAGAVAILALGTGLLFPRLRVAAEPVTGYRDVPAAHWAAGSIRRLSAAGVLMRGAEGYFHPDDPISRQDLASWLLLARRIYSAAPDYSPFADVLASDPWAAAADTAYRLALFELDKQGNFMPLAAVTRQEAVLAALRVSGREGLARSVSVNGDSLPFSDASHIGALYRPYVAAAVRSGWVDAGVDRAFDPTAHLTRAEAAALIARLLIPPHEPRTLDEAAALASSAPAASIEPALTARNGREVPLKQLFVMRATAYGAGEPWLSDITFTGIRVRRGLVAVDPRVIPLGSILYVEGYGYALAADTGSAIKGHRIDLYSADAQEVAMFGVQQRRVWVLQ